MLPAPPPPPRYAEVAIVHQPHGGQQWHVLRRFGSAAACLAVLPHGRLLVVNGRLTFEQFYCVREPLHPPPKG